MWEIYYVPATTALGRYYQHKGIHETNISSAVIYLEMKMFIDDNCCTHVCLCISDAIGAAAEGRTVGKAEVLALLEILQDYSQPGNISIRDCLTVTYECGGKTAGAVIVREKWSGKILAFVKPSNDYNHPYSQLAGSSLLAAVPLPPSVKLLAAYSTVCPATRPEARILRQLIAETTPAGEDFGLGGSRTKRLKTQLMEEGTVLQLVVGPVPHAFDLSERLGGDAPLPEIKRERMAATLAAEFGALIVLDLLSGTFVDRVQLGSPARKHNLGNLMVMKSPGDNDEQVSLVAIDTDLFWDRVGQYVTQPASNAIVLHGLQGHSSTTRIPVSQ